MTKTPGHIISLHKCTINDNLIMYGCWDIKRDKQNFVSFWTVQNFAKLKKTPRKMIILHMCIINGNHMMYGSWDMEHDTEYFVIFECFCPFTRLTNRKIKILKTEKNTWRYHHFTQVYQKSWLCAILFLRYAA